MRSAFRFWFALLVALLIPISAVIAKDSKVEEVPKLPDVDLSGLHDEAMKDSQTKPSSSTTSTDPMNTSTPGPNTGSATDPPVTTPNESIDSNAMDPNAPADAAPALKPAVPEVKKPTEEQLKKRNELFSKAALLMRQKKYDEAIKMFDAAHKTGGDSGVALIYMGNCYYNKRAYPLALKSFQRAEKEATDGKVRYQAEAQAARLATYMRGVCPANCLKASSPGWVHQDASGGPTKGLWIHFRYTDGQARGTVSFSSAHIGEVIGFNKGIAYSKGTCPTCGGTGRVSLP